jgi:hypothetical protein
MNLRTIDLGRLESKIGVNRGCDRAWTRGRGEKLGKMTHVWRRGCDRAWTRGRGEKLGKMTHVWR